MLMCTLGLAEAFKSRGVRRSPDTGIATSAIKVVGSDEMLKNCRTPEIVADTAYSIYRMHRQLFR